MQGGPIVLLTNQEAKSFMQSSGLGGRKAIIFNYQKVTLSSLR